MRNCTRCGRALHAQAPGRITLAVTEGVPPGAVSWRGDYPWPAVILCGSCSQAVAQVMASSPVHVRGQGPVERAEWEARERAAGRA
jgi:hypothetical protein